MTAGSLISISGLTTDTPNAKALAIWDFNDGRVFTGDDYDLNKEFVIENAPHRLTLSVTGIEDDGVFSSSTAKTPSVPPPATFPQNPGQFDENVAKDEWDLTRFPTTSGQTYQLEFKLVSMSGGNLSFEVYGYWEVTRTKP